MYITNFIYRPEFEVISLHEDENISVRLDKSKDQTIILTRPEAQALVAALAAALAESE